jgi:hypothetical protein
MKLYKKIILLFAFLILLILITYNYVVYGYKLDNLYDPQPMLISTESSRTQILDLEIARRCLYTYELEFRSKRSIGKAEHIRELLDYKPYNTKFPLNFDLRVINSIGESVLNISVTEGVAGGGLSGDGSLVFDIGHGELLPGKYKIHIITSSLNSDLKDIDMNLFVKHLYKVKCKEDHFDVFWRRLSE